MLIGLVLIGLCCIYLLYSNFSKVREIEELKRRVEDLKKIFLNQQVHNDETFSRLNTVIFNGSIANHPSNHPETIINPTSSSISTNIFCNENKDIQKLNNAIAKEVVNEIKKTLDSHTDIIHTKTININADITKDVILDNTTNITVKKEGYINLKMNNIKNDIANNNANNDSNNNSNNEFLNAGIDDKAINLDLEDLDNLNAINEYHTETLEDNLSLDDLDENCEEIDADLLTKMTNNTIILDDENIEITKENLFVIEPNINSNNEIFDDLEDTLSIATEPIGDSNDVINSHSNFNLDDIKDIDDIDNLEPIHIKTVQIDTNHIINKTNIDNSSQLTDSNIICNNNVKTDILEDVTDLDNVDLDDILNGNITSQKSQNSTESNDKTVKKINISDANKSNLQNMSIKQLKDLAKAHKLKTTGTKQELIHALEKIL